ncbi:aspartate--ammonia ligase [Pseudidiomarina aestuarii]|uniref:Aspartate--ammonia ligase n=1 Tax=Pseudidiomarina aestuarii TaxID=624146 RepID=A0A7Z6ZS21_9GAMM|nr:aspartate--ammonia ligase [Pseudidiomarina aestuarii]RUO39197.1 aspartate--ammonia ligase [Pseudidiomarina aestuarii]
MKTSTFAQQQLLLSQVKHQFASALAQQLQLIPVQAPLIMAAGSGMQDGLAGHEQPVKVRVQAEQADYEVVHSLAKWKRALLGQQQFAAGSGIVTDMRALRPDEEKLSERHSVLVEQWDWERVIQPQERTIATLKETVRGIYSALKHTVRALYPDGDFPVELPTDVTFIHAEQLRQAYPDLTPKQRERAITHQHNVVFIIGIGGALGDGEKHDVRAPDYDDWTSATELEWAGLNGDLLVWHPLLDDALELSSMGIRVDAPALLRQLELSGKHQHAQLPWHRLVLSGQLPQTIGGGIGQSRVAMWVLQYDHISATQATLLDLPKQPVSVAA